MKLVIIFILGVLFGGLVVKHIMNHEPSNTPVIGCLRVIWEEGEESPYIFLEVSKDINVFHREKQVTLDVITTNVSQD